MTVLPFLGLAFGGAAASLLLRRWMPASAAIGILALAGATIAALAIRPADGLAIAGSGMAGSAYARLFLALAAGSSTVLAVIGVATGWTRNLPGSLLAGLGAMGAALTLPDPTMAAAATLAGGLAGVLVTVHGTPTARGVAVAAREVRAVAVGGALVLLAMAWISRPLGGLAQDPSVFGLAYVAVAIGIAMRFGAIPFHLWVARVSDAALEVALPLLIAWGPAALAVVGLAWVDGSISPVAPVTGQLPAERGVIIAIGIACLILGAIAAWVQDDLEHVVAYATVQDAGVIILAFAVLDPSIWAPSRTWILVFVTTRTALAAWAVAARSRFGTRRIGELRGWARRSPILVAALLGIAVASVGWPGFAAFEARASVIRLALDGPFEGLVLIGVFLPLLYFGRLLAVGLSRPTPEIAAVPDDRPRARPVDARWEPETRAAAVRMLGAANRGPIVAALVVVLAASALTVASGGFGFVGVADAAAEPAPVGPLGGSDVSAPGPAESAGPGDGNGPSGSPEASESPAISPTPSASASATPQPSATPSRSPTASPSPSRSPTPSPRPSPSPSPSGSKGPSPSP